MNAMTISKSALARLRFTCSALFRNALRISSSTLKPTAFRSSFGLKRMKRLNSMPEAGFSSESAITDVDLIRINLDAVSAYSAFVSELRASAGSSNSEPSPAKACLSKSAYRAEMYFHESENHCYVSR
ncbi:protein of unknown function [Methylocaldum szegediense]|uniref:Uncharacterized protein n=1 Tax=Methylocaldum szegediense TaxID=73780 RepID=A0ABM9HX47_9GAMM|nr:protein of unknown function [Methylocaldum szegediense]